MINKKFSMKIFLATLLIILYFTTHYNYLLFHSISELFSIIIASTIFVIAWNSKQYMENSYLTFIGIAYLFIGGLDLLHTLSYKGMNIFKDYDFYANQLWIIARYLESISLIIGLVYFQNIKKVRVNLVLIAYFIITSLGILSIFYFKIFPICFVEGAGQTQFKIVSEYIINIILVIGLIILWKKRSTFEKHVYKYVKYSIILTIISELAFTFYVSNYGFSNLVGHYAKLISFYLIYRALVETGIKRPYKIIFKELTDKKEELEKANKTKNKFFSIVAHDLKGPVGACSGLLSELNNFYADMNDSERKELIDDLDISAKNISSFLNDLLEWARVHMNKITYEPSNFNLNEIILKILSVLKINADKKEIEIKYSEKEDLIVYGDENMVNAIIRNLLSNAIKFTERTGVIKIEIIKEYENVKVSIEDDGVGMDEKAQKEIFKIDSNYSTTGTEDEEGTGLGLLITKEFVKKNNGKIWVDSQKGVGTTFYFTIPRKKE